jgi:amino acid transporter/nucleotide-binding universal stress UspA family protein
MNTAAPSPVKNGGPTASSEVRLSREMRLFDVIMIGVGAMIGAGIFVLTGIAAGVAGPGLILAFLLNTVVTLFAAAAYAELGSAFHDAGGSYLWVKLGLKDPQGFMSGWMDWFAHAVACSLYALGFGAYFKLVLPLLGVPDFATPVVPVEKWLAVAVIVVFAYINYRGASETGGAGNIVTMGKLVVLVVFIAFGVGITLLRPDWQPVFTEDFLPNGYGSLFVAMGLTFIAFEGYEIIAQCSEEVQRPERNVPRAIFISLLIVVPIYLLVAFAALGAVQVEGLPSWKFLGEQKETALVDVAKSFFPGGGVMILIGGLLSTVSALNATIYSSSRVSLAMGRDRNLPAFFGKVHPVRKTPHGAIAGSAVLIAFMAVALPIETVASAANIMFLLLFIQVQAVLIALRRKRPEIHRGFKVPLVPFIPAIGIALQLFLAAYLFVYSPIAWLSAGVWIALGLATYYLYARKREAAHEQVVEMREAAERKEYRILACVGRPHHAAPILNAAGLLAREHDGELIALSVIEVPDRELLAQGWDQANRVRQGLNGALGALRGDGLPLKSLIKISHRISFGITETVLEEQCNMVVIGRPRRVGLIQRFASTVVDRVIRETPAQTMVVSAERWPEEVRTILFAYESGPYSKLTTDVVAAFARATGAKVSAVHVLSRAASVEEHERALKGLNEALGGRFEQGELKVVRANDPVAGLLGEMRGVDLIILGGTDAGLIEQVLGYAIPLELADRTANPVITVYEMPAEPKRWLK